jgi:hypothetical protein
MITLITIRSGCRDIRRSRSPNVMGVLAASVDLAKTERL